MPEVYFAHPDYGYARDFRGYGESGLPTLKWPENAKIAISFVINYEEVGSRLSAPYSKHPANIRRGESGPYSMETESVKLI